VRWHRLAATGVLALGVLLAMMPDRKNHLIAMVSDPSYVSPCPEVRMTVDELAFRLVDRESNIRLVDVRSPEAYAAFALPNSINLSLEDLFTKDAVPTLAPRNIKKVLIGDTEQEERIAGYLLKELGYENCAMLEGGIGTFRTTILEPGILASTGTRWDADVNAFREEAKRVIPAMIREQQVAATRQPKPVKKIKGGC
jgi:rhodanese-related sulfurtransferase